MTVERCVRESGAFLNHIDSLKIGTHRLVTTHKLRRNRILEMVKRRKKNCLFFSHLFHLRVRAIVSLVVKASIGVGTRWIRLEALEHHSLMPHTKIVHGSMVRLLIENTHITIIAFTRRPILEAIEWRVCPCCAHI